MSSVKVSKVQLVTGEMCPREMPVNCCSAAGMFLLPAVL